jgi:hypothetical protein
MTFFLWCYVRNAIDGCSGQVANLNEHITAVLETKKITDACINLDQALARQLSRNEKRTWIVNDKLLVGFILVFGDFICVMVKKI